MWKSEVDDVGMFVVVQLRNDIEKAKEVSAEITKRRISEDSVSVVRRSRESENQTQNEEITKKSVNWNYTR